MDKEYKTLKEASENYQLEELDEDTLWVTFQWEDAWLRFSFWEFVSRISGAPKLETKVSLIFCGEGPSGNLRECRHTNWGEDGYIFYPDAKNIRTALSWLEQYYDMH